MTCAESDPLHAFVNKALLEHIATTISLCIVYDYT